MTLAQLPEIVNGYELNPGRSWLSVIKPKAATNLIRNPDFERGRQAWVHGIVGNATQLDPVNPGGGAYSLVIHSAAGVGLRLETTAIDGSNGQPDMPTVAGRNYVLSFKYRTNLSISTDTLAVSSQGSISNVGVGYTLSSYLVDGRPMAVIPQSSSWRKVVVVFRETVTQSRNIRIATVGSTTDGDIWIDDVQFEEGVDPTTFISGDLSGPAIFDDDYAWSSTPGASSSYRSAKCVAGGVVVNFAQLGFRVTAILGLGLAGQSNVIQSSAYGGGYYSETLTEGTSFQVVGRFDATSRLQLDGQRDAMIQALRHDRAGGVSRPVVLRYEMARCDDVLTASIDIPCVYAGGLEGHVDNLFAEDVVLTFGHYNRELLAERRAGTPLSNIQASYFSAGAATYDRSTDTYSIVSISNVTTITAARPAGDGSFWIVGNFTNAGGIATANYVAKWNPATNAITGYGAGTVSGVGAYDIFVSATGYVYVFGQFSQLGGLTTNNLVRWNPTTNVFNAFGSPNGRVRQVVETPGRVYVFGDFTNIGGSAITAGAWTGDNGVTWNAVSFPIGTVSSVRSAAYDPKTNRLYFGAITGVQSYAGYLDLTAGTATAFIFAPALTVTYEGVFLHPNGNIYMVRSSTSGSATTGILKVVGTGSVDVATYPAAFTLGVSRTWQDSLGLIHLATTQTYALGGVLSPAQYHVFDGEKVTPSPIHVGRNAYQPIVFSDVSGTIRLWARADLGALSWPGLTTIADVGSSSPVVLRFQGPGILIRIDNITTGQSIRFNMTIRTGEVIEVDTRTGRVSSSINSGALAGVLSQSSISRWRLAPGSNRIRLQFWPRLSNGSDEYQAVLSGTANVPGIAFLQNASMATSDRGRIYWDVDASDNGILRLAYGSGPRLGLAPGPSTSALTPTTDLPVQLVGYIDLVPLPGPAAGVIWYPLAHLYFDDQLAAIDSAAGR